MEIGQLLIRLIHGIEEGVSLILQDLKMDLIFEIIESIMPLLQWFSARLGDILCLIGGTALSDYDVINGTTTLGETGTVASAFFEMSDELASDIPTIVGPMNGTSGITYILNGTTSVLTNDGSIFLYELFDFLTRAIGLIADYMYDLPSILPI